MTAAFALGTARGVQFHPEIDGDAMRGYLDARRPLLEPEGFDVESGEWLEGYDTQREAWEKRYASARERFEAHKKQQEDAQKADADAATESGDASSYTSEVPESSGTLASDEALAALREKLAGR